MICAFFCKYAILQIKFTFKDAYELHHLNLSWEWKLSPEPQRHFMCPVNFNELVVTSTLLGSQKL